MRSKILSAPFLATLVAAAPRALLEPQGACHNNLALDAIEILRASAFCSSFIHISTQTSTKSVLVTKTLPYTVSATSTVTKGQTAHATTTTVLTDTATLTLPGPVGVITNTITDTATVIDSVTDTFTSTATVTVSTFIRNQPPTPTTIILPRGPGAPPCPEIPRGLEKFAKNIISTACSCYVTTPTAYKTTSITKTVTSTATKAVTVTTSPVVTTNVQTVTATSSITVTITGPLSLRTTSTEITAATTTIAGGTTTVPVAGPTVTVTVPAATFVFVEEFSNSCVPIGSLEYYNAISNINTNDDLFQYCAGQCIQNAQCNQIWIAMATPDSDGAVCILGGGDAPTSWNDNTIQCSYNPIGKVGDWYNLQQSGGAVPTP